GREIGELPLDMQPKLLQVLEEKEFERIGGTKIIKSDFRVIAATNKDLETLIQENGFRSDLYYRLNVFPIHIPPLRERKADIPELAKNIIRQLAEETAVKSTCLSEEAENALTSHHWPGNIRELSNVLERTISSINGENITLAHLPFYIREQKNKNSVFFQGLDLKERLDRTEKELIEKVMQVSGGNKMEAARQLGIHRTHLYKKLRKHGLK
ncbi:MAG: sigma-54-dependent Fis family transcriptional regulator, partial [Desulfobacterales bacterium]|nr:sigma-54-dependent Fis family transcriptional regulator [Desulfobacterales bacterium]